MWRSRDERSEEKSIISYIALDEKLRKEVLDANIVRGVLKGSCNFAVLAEIRIREIGVWKE